VAKPSKSVVKKLVKVWDFDPTLAERLFYRGDVLTCDRCREPFLRAECRTSLTGPYADLDESSFGLAAEKEDICWECLPEKARAYLFNAKLPIPEGACAECCGKGRLPCPYCKTTTRADCAACNGVGGEECRECMAEGTVNVTCAECEGKGKRGFRLFEGFSDYGCLLGLFGAIHDALVFPKCHECKGEGTIRNKCEACDGDGRLEECENCGGSGKVACPHCSGAATIKCPACSGMGKNRV
jgi:hypothetical protein